MTDYYKTPKGRVVTANDELRKLVSNQSGKFGSYAPCDKEGNILSGDTLEATIPISQHHQELEKAKALSEEQGVEKGWAEAKEALTPAIEEAKAQATAEAEEAAAAAIEEAKAEAFEAGKKAGLEAAKASTSNKKKGQ